MVAFQLVILIYEQWPNLCIRSFFLLIQFLYIYYIYIYISVICPVSSLLLQYLGSRHLNLTNMCPTKLVFCAPLIQWAHIHLLLDSTKHENFSILLSLLMPWVVVFPFNRTILPIIQRTLTILLNCVSPLFKCKLKIYVCLTKFARGNLPNFLIIKCR